jgi:DNA-binding transcriptional regulator YiaG
MYLSKAQSKLTPSIIARIRKSKQLKIQLLIQFNISPSTLQLWLDKNNSNFTQIDSLLILKEYFELNTIEELYY